MSCNSYHRNLIHLALRWIKDSTYPSFSNSKSDHAKRGCAWIKSKRKFPSEKNSCRNYISEFGQDLGSIFDKKSIVGHEIILNINFHKMCDFIFLYCSWKNVFKLFFLHCSWNEHVYNKIFHKLDRIIIFIKIK